ncbi:hypothetical protein AAGG74_18390 [Bacillus mexicanus]|uniref:hypothetical protein n=1 Tax=Bacillus mexicanus TaxID=2834415 RepID=UPI003D1D1C6B
MSTSNYGTMGSTSDPKQFVLQLLKKVLLNNKNAVKFLDDQDYLGLEKRVTNSIHCLEELNLGLNRENYNPTVEMVSAHYEQMINFFEEVLLDIEQKSFEKEKFDKVIIATDKIIKNLYDGFAGMRD